MKNLSREEIDAAIRLKWRELVCSPDLPSQLSYADLGKIFKVSHTYIRKQILKRMVDLDAMRNRIRTRNQLR